MYEGNTYEIIIESYQTKEGMEQGTETPETTTLTFEGGTAKVEKTVVNLVKVEPEPNVVYPTEDQLLSFKDDRKVVTVEVDKKVKVKNCVYPMGMYGTLDWEKAEVSYTEEGHSIIKCTMSEAFYNFMGTIVTDVILQLDLTDEEGNEIEPKAEGFPESVVFGSGYNFTFGVNDGRFADASLNFKSVTPAENSYSTSLGKMEFAYDERVYITSTANAAVYKGEEKVADAILTSNEDETGCTSLNLVYFKESFPYGVPCFLLMQKTSFHVAKGHVLQRESIPFALLKDVFCVAGLMLLPEPLWRHGHDNTIRHTIQRFFRQTGVSFCGLSERRARCA